MMYFCMDVVHEISEMVLNFLFVFTPLFKCLTEISFCCCYESFSVREITVF